jgi:hypothetical protein
MTLIRQANELSQRLDQLTTDAHNECERVLNLAVPLVKAIQYELVTGLTTSGKESLSELDAYLTERGV